MYLMLVLGGNATPTKADVATAMSSVGLAADDAQLDKLLSDLADKDLGEVIESGTEQLAKFGGGGGGGGGGAGGGGGDGGAEEEEKEEEVEEEAEAPVGGGGLFGDDGGDGGDY